MIDFILEIVECNARVYEYYITLPIILAWLIYTLLSTITTDLLWIFSRLLLTPYLILI